MKKFFSTFLKGLAMGTVDIIPGVSGGTMALILKIYDQIIEQLQLLNFKLLKSLLKGKFKEVFSQINWRFLLALFAGIITAIISLARVISWGLENYPVYLFSLFFGLIIISSILLIPFKKMKASSLLFLIVGFVIAWVISTFSPASTPENYAFIFLSGALAICAMILPGISGAFILLLLGKYEFMINALKNPFVGQNIFIILIFAIACVFGLIIFSKFLNFLLKKYYQATLLILIGFMLGSLNKIWPFKETLATKIINGQEIITKQQNVWPLINQEFFIALSLAALGIVLGYLLSRVKKEEK